MSNPSQKLLGDRRRFKEEVAPQLVKNAGGSLKPGARISDAAERFEDDERLWVVVGRHEAADASNNALLYALRHRKPAQKITLMLPREHSAAVRARLPWLVPTITLFVYEEANQVSLDAPTKDEILGAFRDPLAVSTHELGDRGPWVKRLVDWADARAELERASRGGYLAWHCRGRMVLRVSRTRGGVSVLAGVNYSKPTASKPAPLEYALQGALADDTLAEAQAAIERAIANRLEGGDKDNEEHELQSALETHRLLGFEAEREFPAMRGDSRAYLDFLGQDAEGVVHVVETKVGAKDSFLVLQGLDYWIWARAHRRDLAAHFGREPTGFAIDFVVRRKPGGEFVNSYAGICARALAEEVRFRFLEVVGEGENMRLDSLGWRGLP